VDSVISVVHTTQPRLGYRAKSQKPKNYAENLIECQNSILHVQRKKLSAWQFRRGTYPCVEQLKSIQKRAIRIIFSFAHEISFPYALFAANFNSLHFRRYDISKSFFQDICDPSSCIHHFLHLYTTLLFVPRNKKYFFFTIYSVHIKSNKSTQLIQDSTCTMPTSFSILRYILFCNVLFYNCSIFTYSTVTGHKLRLQRVQFVAAAAVRKRVVANILINFNVL